MPPKWEYQPLDLRGYRPHDDGSSPPTSAPPVESHVKPPPLATAMRETAGATKRLTEILRQLLEGNDGNY